MQLLMLAILSAIGTSVTAQYDDLYYDPDDDTGYYGTYRTDTNTDDQAYPSNGYDYNDDYYDDDEFEYYDDYDYQYTSRIRRFHRPYYGFDFFDPVYIDLAYYDPFFMPGRTVLIYDDFYSFNTWGRRWNRWNRWNRFNRWGGGVNIFVGNGWGGFGWNDPWGWNRWNRWGGGWNSWGPGWNSWNSWGWNSWGGGFSNVYCPPSWGNGNVYNTVVNVNSNNVYYGPRNTGVSKVPRKGNRVVKTSNPGNATTGRAFANGVSADVNTGDIRTPNTGNPGVRQVESGRTLDRATPRVNTKPDTKTTTTGRGLDRAPATTRQQPRISRDNALMSDRTPTRSYERNTTSPSRPKANTKRTTRKPRTTTSSSPRNYQRPKANTNSSRSYDRGSSRSNRSYDRGSSRSNSRSYNRSSNRSSSKSRSYNKSSRSNNNSSLNRSSNRSSSKSRSYNRSSSSKPRSSGSSRSSSKRSSRRGNN
jgi:hypothetical protein